MHDQSTVALGAFANRTIGQGLHACDLKLHSERTIEGQRSGSEIHMPLTMGQSPMSYDVAACFLGDRRTMSRSCGRSLTEVSRHVSTCIRLTCVDLILCWNLRALRGAGHLHNKHVKQMWANSVDSWKNHPLLQLLGPADVMYHPPPTYYLHELLLLLLPLLLLPYYVLLTSSYYIQLLYTSS